MATITFRTDPATDEALAALTATGRDRSQVIREAVAMAARLKRAAALRAEATALAADAIDQREAGSVLQDLEDLRAW